MKATKEENRFYVYAYLDQRKPGKYAYGDFLFDYEPFYVGKGEGNRNKKHIQEAKSILKHNISNKEKKHLNWKKINKILKINRETNTWPIVIKLKENILEKESSLLEINCIKIIGRQDLKIGPLTNLTDGGEGQKNKIMSKETKEKISKSLSGEKNPNYGKKGEESNGYGYKHTEEAKQKISKNNSKYWLGKPKTEETKKKISLNKKGKGLPKKTKEALHIYLANNPLHNTKNWKLISPDKEILIIQNLTKFCRENNLKYRKLLLVAQGKINHHKGWKCEYILRY